jgi:hypothetical protein
VCSNDDFTKFKHSGFGVFEGITITIVFYNGMKGENTSFPMFISYRVESARS